MMEPLRHPQLIEDRSFEIIDSEMGNHAFTPEQYPVVQRVIHASADFELGKSVVFDPRAIEAGVAALRAGCDVVTDVQMIQAGINRANLASLGGGQVRCFISDPEVVEEARAAGLTRAIISMRKAAREAPGAIVAIGNAPTALLEMVRLVKAGEARPALIVGMPVGFVSAAESKEELTRLDWPFIANRGRKGGSSVVVATVNALMLIARSRAG